MARARLLKPGFFTNDTLAEVQPLGRLLFAGLWTLADREGRLADRPKSIKAQLLPFDRVNVEALLASLVERGFISRYKGPDNEAYIQILAFSKHQSPHIKEPASTIPAPYQHRASPAETVSVPDTETVPEAEAVCGCGPSPGEVATLKLLSDGVSKLRGGMTAAIADDMRHLATVIPHDDAERVTEYTFRETGLVNGDWRYARRILERLERNGWPADLEGEHGNTNSRRRNEGAGRSTRKPSEDPDLLAFVARRDAARAESAAAGQ